jgi:hypothetical protein
LRLPPRRQRGGDDLGRECPGRQQRQRGQAQPALAMFLDAGGDLGRHAVDFDVVDRRNFIAIVSLDLVSH